MDTCLFVCLFVCLFIGINPGKIYEWEPWNYVPFGTFTDNPSICPRIMDRETFSFVMCKFHQMSQMSHQLSHL